MTNPNFRRSKLKVKVPGLPSRPGISGIIHQAEVSLAEVSLSFPIMINFWSSDAIYVDPESASYSKIEKRTSDMPSTNERHQVWVLIDDSGEHQWNNYVGFGTSASSIFSRSNSVAFDSEGNVITTVHTGQDGTSTGRLVRFYDADGTTYKTFQPGSDKVNDILNYGAYYPEHFIVKFSGETGEILWLKRYGYDGSAGDVRWDSWSGAHHDHIVYDSENNRVLVNACLGRPNSVGSNNKFRAGFDEDDEWGFTMVGNNSYLNVSNLCFSGSDGSVDSEPSLYFEGNTGNIYNFQWYGYPTIDIWQDTGDQIHSWYIDNENWYQKSAVDNSIQYTHTSDATKGKYFSIIQKVSSTGSIYWTRDLWGTSSGGAVKEESWPQAVKTLSDGSCLIAHRLEQAADTFISETSGADYTVVPDSSITGDAMILLRYDSDGGVVWSSTFGCTSGSGEPVTELIEVDDEEEYCYLFTPGNSSSNTTNVRFNCSNTSPAAAGTTDLNTGANGNGMIAKFDLSTGACVWATRGGEDGEFHGIFFRNNQLFVLTSNKRNDQADDELIYGSSEMPPDYHGDMTPSGNLWYVTLFNVDPADGSYVDGSKKLVALVENNGYSGIGHTAIDGVFAG